jgi:RimJ/RimL family protein N-acetyltransferase
MAGAFINRKPYDILQNDEESNPPLICLRYNKSTSSGSNGMILESTRPANQQDVESLLKDVASAKTKPKFTSQFDHGLEPRQLAASWASPCSEEDTDTWLPFHFVIRDKTARPVGLVGFEYFGNCYPQEDSVPDWSLSDTGYAYIGIVSHGFTIEALTCVIDYGFRYLDLHKVQMVVRSDDHAETRRMCKQLGMSMVQAQDKAVICVVDRHNWRANRRALSEIVVVDLTADD